jgi:hypothetical protein
MKVTIRGGESFDTLTSSELWDALDKRERQRARGVKWMEYAVPLNATPANQITVGPPEGFTWSVRIVSSTLGSAGTLAVYKASASPGPLGTSVDERRLIAFNGTSQTAQAVQLPGDVCMLQHGTALLLVASTTLTNYYLGAWEAVAEQAWKLAD